MAEVKKVATRVSSGEALVELGNEHDDFVVLDADLAAATQTGKFKAAHPERYDAAGIDESNLMERAATKPTTVHVASTSKSVPRMRVSRSVKTAPRISAARTSRSCARSRV